ncbi:MAG: beta-lactamase family protein [Mariniphaga sp.]|nr:beta-lactamase family protein [Mariniphaga sp.]
MRTFWRSKLTFVIGLLILIGCQNNSQPVEKEKIIDKFLSECFSKGFLNGNVLVAEKGKIIYQKAFGISGDESPLTLESQFRLASVSKQVTAMTIMMLKEKRLLSFEDPVKKYIPELPYEGATIRHLLNHTSGLPDYVTLLEEKWKPELNPDDRNRTVDGIEEILKTIVEHKPEGLFEAGEKYEYSNTGYVFLAIIIERISGIPLHQLMKENIFDPLEMNNTFLTSPVRKDPLKNRVRGYYLSEDKKEIVLNDFSFLNSAQGDGEIFSTVNNLYKWDRAQYTEKLISKKTLEEAYTTGVLNNGATTHYGFGLDIGKSKSYKTLISHGGGWLGFRTWIGREIDDNNTIIVLTNNSTNHLSVITEGLQNILHNKPYKIP